MGEIEENIDDERLLQRGGGGEFNIEVSLSFFVEIQENKP